MRKHEISSTEKILLYINMRILKLSIGNAVLQQRHMPYIAVRAGLIHTTHFIYQGLWLQFETKDLATDLISKYVLL